MNLRDEILKIEEQTMRGLKDFQQATVERVAYLFEHGQNRVLVADEVGLGKTLVARGVIAKMADIRLLREDDDFFKVVYVCSNQNIARQNIRKLNIFSAEEEDVSDTRLSMQHLRVTEQKLQQKEKEQYVQLIPLTPETSFRMTSGGGSVNERALMFAILRRMPELSGYEKELEEFLICYAASSWEWNRDRYEERVADCEKRTNGDAGPYPQNIIRKIYEYDQNHQILSRLIEYLQKRRDGSISKKPDLHLADDLRFMFSHIGVDMLEPDFVIMDEFQRFRFLINEEEKETETGLLAEQFLHREDARVLLLSATPYKLYSTMEEIEENQVDEPFSEFQEVMDFLLPGGEEAEDFRQVWTNYSVALRELKAGDTAILSLKQDAEDSMYSAMCRTERISVMESGDYTDDSSVSEHLKITEDDVRSYTEMEGLLQDIHADFSLPVDYVKSCPYLMSFMRNYQVKSKIEKYFEKPEHIQDLKKANRHMLWLDDNKIRNYKKLPATNARLEELKRQIFQNRSELYLWVPPSRPYYEMQGVYKNSEGFSKILVFSSWEMVPRMIGGLVSYESERLTIGSLGNQTKNEDRKNTEYFARRRFPYQRLTFRETDGRQTTMSLLCLLYPSKTLAEFYHPVDCMNAGMNLDSIENMLRQQIEVKLLELQEKYSTTDDGRVDEQWYYMAPVLMDGDFALEWIRDNLRDSKLDDDLQEERGRKGFRHHLEHLQELLEHVALGRMPADLTQTLINMTLGSPAVCIYRSNGNDAKRATELAKVFLNRFNQPETTAIVELAYTRRKDDYHHWQDVLRYCKDGNFQAMFDEYLHLLKEEVGFGDSEEISQSVHEAMKDALRFRAASYDFDTYPDFYNRMKNGGKIKRKSAKRLRSHFAVGFTESDGDKEKDINRKESVRNSFNSPLRPFVLATTSIGQEGLDFHNYCRKVMHWNLPGNPVELEQREGRVNRYKCLAIRQNVAKEYGNIEFQTDDIWEEMFDAAAKAEEGNGHSELVPYWCFGKNQSVKIERIVPMYPVSKDEATYERLIKILSLYRLTMGQARQEELLDYMFKEFEDDEELKELFINLSPYSKQRDHDSF